MHNNAYSQWFHRYLEVFETIQPFRKKRIDGRHVLMSHFPYEEFGDGIDRPGNRYVEFRLPDCGALLIHGHTHESEITKWVRSQ